MKKKWEKWAGNQSVPVKSAEIIPEGKENAGLFPALGRGENGLPIPGEEEILEAKHFVDEESRL